jgi:hypothetical protein
MSADASPRAARAAPQRHSAGAAGAWAGTTSDALQGADTAGRGAAAGAQGGVRGAPAEGDPGGAAQALPGLGEGDGGDGAARSRTAWLQQRRELAGSAVAKNWEAFKSRNPATVQQARLTTAAAPAP